MKTTIPTKVILLTHKKKMHALIISVDNDKGRSRLELTRPSWEAVMDSVTVLSATRGDAVQLSEVHPSAAMRIHTHHPWNVFGQDGDTLHNVNSVACALSHMRAWREIVRLNKPRVVIEDDTKFNGTREQLQHTLQSDALFVSLYAGCHPRVSTVLECADSSWGFQCYYMTPEGAALLLKSASPPAMHIDRYLATRVLQTRDARFVIAQPQLPCIEVENRLLSSLSHPEVYQVIVGVLIGVGVVLATVVAVVALLRSRRDRLALDICKKSCG